MKNIYFYKYRILVLQTNLFSNDIIIQILHNIII